MKGAAVNLLSFAKAISIDRRSSEKLFKILDLHDALTDLLPGVTVIFQSRALESLNNQVSDIIARLAEAVRRILSEFENAVLREPQKMLFLEIWSEESKEKKFYIVLISFHGLVHGKNMEPSCDSDTMGQKAAPEIDWSYGEPIQRLGPYLAYLLEGLIARVASTGVQMINVQPDKAYPMQHSQPVRQNVNEGWNPKFVGPEDGKLIAMAPYNRPVTSRCYVSTFRAICDSFREVISAEVENSLRTVNIHQFLFFPAFH
ncbi:hypothetical protein M5K25_020772 [Dendrobium thyrsiflorum]|uniref:Exocyst subunit Exo70 family protein n=1 Tax=Dendrobium thyrsiflorum TaxID=117978 RepID=A0ABD0UAU8_DENTH